MHPPARRIGIDIGGSKIASAAVAAEVTAGADPDDLLRHHRSDPWESRDYEAAVDGLARQVRWLLDELAWPDAAVGVSVAAFLTPDRSGIVEALNLGWRDRPLARDLSVVLDLPVTLHNDANAAVWGEYLLAGSPAEGAFVLLTLGTDVGGGVVVDGRLLTGAHGIAGELGHLTVDPGGQVCVCGAAGCLAVYASGAAIAAGVRAAVPAADLARAGGGAPAVTALARRGDERVLAVVDRAAAAIAAASGQISRVVDHHTLVLGGGAADLGDPLLAAVRRHLSAGVPVGPVRPHPHVRAARAGNRAGVLGAADLAGRR
ncbi:ROK family protein [Nakamurella endophytica]|uniref:ROK family protein n=1 Tax=Nakamurella endophytica TaxID=1748367 RepID=UPI001665097D|nr:ROK family protein [Nakamurella endophytica]